MTLPSDEETALLKLNPSASSGAKNTWARAATLFAVLALASFGVAVTTKTSFAPRDSEFRARLGAGVGGRRPMADADPEVGNYKNSGRAGDGDRARGSVEVGTYKGSGRAGQGDRRPAGTLVPDQQRQDVPGTMVVSTSTPNCATPNPGNRRCLSAVEVAQLAIDVQGTNRGDFCITAVAVAFGESAEQDTRTNACPAAYQKCFDADVVNPNSGTRGLWQLMNGGGGSVQDQARSMLNYATTGFCTATGWPRPDQLEPLDNLPVNLPQWRFCKGAWTGDNPPNAVDPIIPGEGPNYYQKYKQAATDACVVAGAA